MGARPLVVVRVALADAAAERLAAAFPRAQLAVCPGDDGLAAHLADAEVLVGGVDLAADVGDRAPNLKWVQTSSVGIEGFLDFARAHPGVTLTNSRGANTVPLAEHALMLMLNFARGMPELSRRQAARTWLPPSRETAPQVFELSDARLGLVGYGRIGREIARRAKAFGMEVWALRRSGGDERDGPADRILGPEQLGELAAAVDHLMVVAPLTPQTHGMIGAEVFQAMKPTAYLYNLGRGAVVDHAALVEALQSGKIAGAGLEVVEPEPLPASSALWSLPNVILTGHTAGFTPRLAERILEFWAAQLARYARGEPLENRVDLAAGY